MSSPKIKGFLTKEAQKNSLKEVLNIPGISSREVTMNVLSFMGVGSSGKSRAWREGYWRSSPSNTASL